MKVFLDTTVLVSSVATRGLCADVFREVITNHQLVISPSLFTEVETVLREKIGAPQDNITSFTDLLKQDSIISDSNDLLVINIQDTTDIPILSSAYYEKAEYFITGDKQILALIKVKEMAIVSPRMFWEKLTGLVTKA
jgi:putative PIN family toxin of toxin-antitoxin system